ncbi:uncharacterized protein L203_100605 [Cryptococcus depauperatus CBS 7841]|uniref:Uncharacterized protein n=1 Tax=Cryptococcus depauperatus CBS 7841 TaxID=1295531 RepID=A0A1E3IX31_9TREE|nr:hypothetical protein L203_00391 [Cryptococcus depauperatus CBS 7841]
MKAGTQAILVAALLPLSVYAGMYGQPVLHLDSKTFKSVMATEHAAIVAFVAPWCGHCKALGPEYTAAAQSLSPLIPFYAVDCDDQINRGLCAQHGVKGFPTIKGFPKAGKGGSRDYTGERKRGPLAEYSKGLVPDRVKKLRIQGAVQPVIQKFLEEEQYMPRLLLIHPSTPSIPFMWKVLAHRLSSRIHFGFIRDTSSHDVLASLGIYDPADSTKDGVRVVAWKEGAERSEFIEYDGILKFNSLLEWLQSFVSGSPLPTPDLQQSQKRKHTKTDASSSRAGNAGEDAASVRKAKLEEAERRDKARREKVVTDTILHDQVEASAEQEKQASPVEEAPDALPEQSAEEEQAQALRHDDAPKPDPIPEDVPVQEGEESKSSGVVHEEL